MILIKQFHTLVDDFVASVLHLSPCQTVHVSSTAHFVIALGKQFTYISSVHPSAKWVPGYRQLKRIDY